MIYGFNILVNKILSDTTAIFGNKEHISHKSIYHSAMTELTMKHDNFPDAKQTMPVVKTRHPLWTHNEIKASLVRYCSGHSPVRGLSE